MDKNLLDALNENVIDLDFDYSIIDKEKIEEETNVLKPIISISSSGDYYE